VSRTGLGLAVARSGYGDHSFAKLTPVERVFCYGYTQVTGRKSHWSERRLGLQPLQLTLTLTRGQSDVAEAAPNDPRTVKPS